MSTGFVDVITTSIFCPLLELRLKNSYNNAFNKHGFSMALTLKHLDESFTIHRLSTESDIPSQVFTAPIYFIAKTYNEVSIVLPENIKINSDAVEPNWQALEVVGPLDFSLTGILSRITTLLANESISIFAISTFDTDYILVKKDAISAAIKTLKLNDYNVIE
jgi:hypothetical protein